MNDGLILVAASGLAREVISACRRADQDARARTAPLLGLLDDDPAKAGRTVSGLPVLGALEAVTQNPTAGLLICAGKGASRRSIRARLASLGVTAERYASVVDPSVHVPANCVVGRGVILLSGTVLTADVTIGDHVVCMPNVTLTHDDVLDDYVTLAAGVTLGGGVRVGEAAYVGMNATVRERCTIGPAAVLGMGSALLTDQPAGSVWVGVPAHEIKKEKA